MSGLGECADNGETGTVSKVMPMPDQIPDNPSTVKATTGIETIMQLLYSNWIWKAQLSVDTSMLPGHVFGLFKIHPQDCHQYVSYFSAPFMAWVGSMKIRARFQATFQYGGSLRIGWLPPKFTREQVKNLSVQTLTAYPNIDLDPKNTGFMEFQAAEERNILFHWMDSVDSDDPASFGGWYVFYVAAPLVISGGGTGEKVTLLVESAGGFDFVQPTDLGAPKPIVSNVIIDQDPLLTQTGCDDFIRIDALQVHALSDRSLPAGWHFARATNGRYTRDVVPNITYTNAMKTFVTAIDRLPLQVVSLKAERNDTFIRFTPDFINEQININSESQAYNLFAIDTGNASKGSRYEQDRRRSTYLYIKGNNACFYDETVTDAGFNVDEHQFRATSFSSNNSPINLSTIKIYNSENVNELDASRMPILQNESLVSFISSNARSINVQTAQMGVAISRSKMDDTTSQLYQLWTEDGQSPLLTVRLTPYGYFTTAASEKPALLYGKNIYFKYLQDLPLADPIPSSAYEKKFLRRAQRATMKGLTGTQLDEAVWEHY